MRLFRDCLYTSDLPATHYTLKKLLPSIYNSYCFNYQKTSFSRKVKDTEIGYLFEHILLEYLCFLKLNRGAYDVEYNGRTSWNWVKYEPGTFDITIDAGFKDAFIMQEAINKTVVLVEMMFSGIKES